MYGSTVVLYSPILDTFKHPTSFLDSVHSVGLSILDLDHLTEGAFTHDFEYDKLALEDVFSLLHVFTWCRLTGQILLGRFVERKLGQRMTRSQWRRVGWQVKGLPHTRHLLRR